MKKIISLFLLLALLLAGCSQGKTDYVPTGGGLYQGETTLPPSPPMSAEQKLSLVYYPEKTLNPYLCADYTNRTLFSLLYQPLYALSPEGEAQPILCSGYQLSRDRKTHVFAVEKATFADGTTLTAADVVLSLEAARKGTVYAGRFTYIDQISVTADGESVQITTTIPYENLDILAGKPVSLDAEDIYRKIVTEHRGGYCFELNALLHGMLSEMGFAVESRFARYLRGESTIPFRRHRIVVVTLDGTEYMLDIGVGQIAPRLPLKLSRNRKVRQA